MSTLVMIVRYWCTVCAMMCKTCFLLHVSFFMASYIGVFRFCLHFCDNFCLVWGWLWCCLSVRQLFSKHHLWLYESFQSSLQRIFFILC